MPDMRLLSDARAPSSSFGWRMKTPFLNCVNVRAVRPAGDLFVAIEFYPTGTELALSLSACDSLSLPRRELVHSVSGVIQGVSYEH